MGEAMKKPMMTMWVWLGFNGLVLLWMLARYALRLRLLFWHDKPVMFAIIITGAWAIMFLGWCVLGLRRLFRRSKALGAAMSILLAASVTALAFFLVPAMILGLGMASSAEWRADYYDSPDGQNTVVVFFGGDTGATSAGPYYSAYPMVCRGVYRYDQGNVTSCVLADYKPPSVQWLSAKKAQVFCGGEAISVNFRRPPRCTSHRTRPRSRPY